MMRAAIILLLGLSLFATQLHAADWGPWEAPATKPQTTAMSSDPLQFAVELFRKYISPVDGPRCPMYPTCSSYSLQALRKHGPLLGVFLTVDRLYREGDASHEHNHPVAKWGFIRFYDPLEANDFWLQ